MQYLSATALELPRALARDRQRVGRPGGFAVGRRWLPPFQPAAGLSPRPTVHVDKLTLWHSKEEGDVDEEDKQRQCNRAHQSDPDSRQQLSASVDAAVLERTWHGAVRAVFLGGNTMQTRRLFQ